MKIVKLLITAIILGQAVISFAGEDHDHLDAVGGPDWAVSFLQTCF